MGRRWKDAEWRQKKMSRLLERKWKVGSQRGSDPTACFPLRGLVPYLYVVGQQGNLETSKLGWVLEVSVWAGRCRGELLMGFMTHAKGFL